MTIIRSWREQKAMLKIMYPILSDEDFDYESGERESMLKKLEKKLKKTREELESLFARLERF